MLKFESAWKHFKEFAGHLSRIFSKEWAEGQTPIQALGHSGICPVPRASTCPGRPSHCLPFHVTTNISLQYGLHSVTCLTEMISVPWLWIPCPCPLSTNGSRDPYVNIFKGLRISLLYENVFCRTRGLCLWSHTLHIPLVEHQAAIADRRWSGRRPAFSLFPAPPGPPSWDLRVLH